MALTQNPVNIGAAPDDNSGDVLRTAFDKLNQGGADAIAAINNLLTLIGAGNETTVDLGTFLGSTIADGRTVKQALQGLETYVEALNVLDAGYTAGAATAPVAGDTIEAAIAKLHGMLSAIDQAVVLRGNWNAGSGTFPGGGTAQAGDSYIVNGAGTVDGVSFAVGDRVIALVDNASTTQQSAWFKADYTDQVGSVFGRQGAVVAQAGDYSATQITNTPAGGIAGTTVQAALNELDGDKLNVSLLAAKGSIVTATAANSPQELGVGVDGEALTADAATASGLRYTAQVSRTLAQANLTANTTLTAGTSVDVATHIVFAQTTTNIQAMIPNPTDLAKHRTIMLANTGTADLGIMFTSGTGFFLAAGATRPVTWTGSRWAATDANLSTQASFARGSRTTVQTVNNNADVIFTQVDAQVGSDITVNTSTGAITLRGGRSYRLMASVSSFSTGAIRPSFSWFNQTTGTQFGSAQTVYSPADAASLSAVGGPAAAIISPAVDTVVSFRNQTGSGLAQVGGNGDFNLAGSYPWFEIQVIGGQAPILGTTVDFASGSFSGNMGPGSIATMGAPSQGNMVVASNLITLRAGRTYRLRGALHLSGFGGNFVSYQWQTAAGGNVGSAAIQFRNTATAYSETDQQEAIAFVTPAVDTQYRLVGVGGDMAINGLTINAAQSWYQVDQIGSTAFTRLDRGRTVVTAPINSATHNTWIDVPAATVVVPAGTYRVGYNVQLRLDNNGDGTMHGEARLLDVTNGNTPVLHSARSAVTVGRGSNFPGFGYSERGTAVWDTVVTNTVPTTYQLQMRKSTVLGSPNVNQNIFCEVGSHIEFVQQL